MSISKVSNDVVLVATSRGGIQQCFTGSTYLICVARLMDTVKLDISELKWIHSLAIYSKVTLDNDSKAFKVLTEAGIQHLLK